MPGNDFVGDGIRGADLGNLVVDLLHPRSERLDVAVAPDVHEEDLRLIEEEVVVQCRHFEARFERRAHRRVDLVLEYDRVAHQHCAIMSRCKRGPGAKAHEGRHAPLIDRDLHVGARLGNFEDILLRDELPLEAGGLLDCGSVEINALGQGAPLTGGQRQCPNEGGEQDIGSHVDLLLAKTAAPRFFPASSQRKSSVQVAPSRRIGVAREQGVSGVPADRVHEGVDVGAALAPKSM